jgi:hypothetical protein
MFLVSLYIIIYCYFIISKYHLTVMIDESSHYCTNAGNERVDWLIVLSTLIFRFYVDVNPGVWIYGRKSQQKSTSRQKGISLCV